MKRRSFLKAAGGVGIGALGGAGVLFARGTKMVALPTEPLRWLTPREYAIFHAVADTVIRVPANQPTIDELQVVLKADEHLAAIDEDSQRDFRRLLSLFDNALAGFLLCGSVTPFTQQSLEGRTAFLDKWQHHRLGVLRSGFQAMKRLSVSCYYGNPKTYGFLGYPGPPEKDP